VTLDLHTLAQVYTGRLLNTLVEGMAVAVFAWLLLLIFDKQNSGTRFAVWFSALISIAALPLLVSSVSGNATNDAPHIGLTLPGSIGVYLFGIWLAIATVLLARLGISLRHVRNLRRNSRELDPATVDPTLQPVLSEFNSARRVKLRVSDGVRVPAAVGFCRPAVIIPEWAVGELSPEDLKAVLLHELAHLQRWDDWTNLAQKVLKALFFFHPAVWWIERRLTLEREMACDDLVLAQTENPRAYASSLISFAERVSGMRGLALAQAVVGRVRQISLRITQILNVNRPKTTRVGKPVLALVGTAVVVAIFATPYTPELVAFENSPTISAQAMIPVENSMPTVVPASFQTDSPKVKPVVALAKHKIVARRLAFREHTPRTIPAGAKRNMNASEVVLVMQSVQYDMSGNAVWTTCVWRMSQAGEVQQQTQTVVMNKL
jgi:bla regulator protein blaR1